MPRGSRNRPLATLPLLGVLVLTLAGCGGSGAGSGTGNVELSGTWIGEWLDSARGSLFAHPTTGTMTVTFSESGGAVSGDIALSPDICDDMGKGDSSGTVLGSLVVDAMDFSYDTPVASTQQPSSVTEISFSATLGDPMEGTYDASSCHSDNWTGTILLSKE